MNLKYDNMPHFAIFAARSLTYFISDWMVEWPSGMAAMMPIRRRNDWLEAT